jgi:hypothetical protein
MMMVLTNSNSGTKSLVITGGGAYVYALGVRISIRSAHLHELRAMPNAARHVPGARAIEEPYRIGQDVKETGGRVTFVLKYIVASEQQASKQQMAALHKIYGSGLAHLTLGMLFRISAAKSVDMPPPRLWPVMTTSYPL